MPLTRCTVLPLPEHQVGFQVDGVERLRWHFGPQYPRPFFYPMLGPTSGQSLTRMGHPGAPDHDHHRSIWFAHEKVTGVNFWSDVAASKIVQRRWLAYVDGDQEAIMAMRLGWIDGHDPKDLVEQTLFAAMIPREDGETFLEIQTTFKPTAEQLEFGKTNFGFLAARVAKALSPIFGGGKITSSTGLVGEKAIFGKQAAWMDFTGVPVGDKAEGITYFDHPSNPGHPTHWHVRDDGWMNASACFAGPKMITKTEPLTLRYLLHAHRGIVEPKRADEVFQQFSKRPGFELVTKPSAGTAFGIRRAAL
jgi:hypothetical protein